MNWEVNYFCIVCTMMIDLSHSTVLGFGFLKKISFVLIPSSLKEASVSFQPSITHTPFNCHSANHLIYNLNVIDLQIYKEFRLKPRKYSDMYIYVCLFFYGLAVRYS